MDTCQNLEKKAINVLNNLKLYKYKGTVSKLLGLTVEVKLPGLKIGDLCYIETQDGQKKAAQVMGFKGEAAQLSLLYDGEGIGQGSLVTSTGTSPKIPVGDFLLGRVINPLGIPIDSKPLDLSEAKWIEIDNSPPDALHRPIITEIFSTGVRAID